MAEVVIRHLYNGSLVQFQASASGFEWR